MVLTLTPLTDYEGLTKGQAYTVYGLTGSTVCILGDKQRLMQIPYNTTADPKDWTFEEVK